MLQQNILMQIVFWSAISVPSKTGYHNAYDEDNMSAYDEDNMSPLRMGK